MMNRKLLSGIGATIASLGVATAAWAQAAGPVKAPDATAAAASSAGLPVTAVNFGPFRCVPVHT